MNVLFTQPAGALPGPGWSHQLARSGGGAFMISAAGLGEHQNYATAAWVIAIFIDCQTGMAGLPRSGRETTRAPDKDEVSN